MTRATIAYGLACLCLLAGPAMAQTVSVSIDDGQTLTTRTIQLIALISVLSVAPGLLIMVTCFPFIITVLSILRQALGLQQAPPNMLLVTLALFLTYFVMEPVLTAAWDQGIKPFVENQMPLEEAFVKAMQPLRAFMSARLDVDTFYGLASLRPEAANLDTPQDAPLSLLVSSFILSEIARAFEIGFMIYLPFLIIDLVVSAVLMSMGMMMVPPVIVSLPFKLAFFVVADGWVLLSGALVRSYF